MPDTYRNHAVAGRPDLEPGATDWNADCVCGLRRRDHVGLNGCEGAAEPRRFDCRRFEAKP